jgi:hypothetical protein
MKHIFLFCLLLKIHRPKFNAISIIDKYVTNLLKFTRNALRVFGVQFSGCIAPRYILICKSSITVSIVLRLLSMVVVDCLWGWRKSSGC